MGSAYEHNPPTGEDSMEKRPQGVPVNEQSVRASAAASSPHCPQTKPKWSQWDRQGDVPAPPPVWTRYIESRMRQFGEGR